MVVAGGKNVLKCSSKDLSSSKGSVVVDGLGGDFFGGVEVVGFEASDGVDGDIDGLGVVWGCGVGALEDGEFCSAPDDGGILSFRNNNSRNSDDNDACKLLCNSNISSSLISAIFFLFSLSISSINSLPSNTVSPPVFSST